MTVVLQLELDTIPYNTCMLDHSSLDRSTRVSKAYSRHSVWFLMLNGFANAKLHFCLFLPSRGGYDYATGDCDVRHAFLVLDCHYWDTVPRSLVPHEGTFAPKAFCKIWSRTTRTASYVELERLHECVKGVMQLCWYIYWWYMIIYRWGETVNETMFGCGSWCFMREITNLATEKMRVVCNCT